jgi:hypothetical protein
MNHNSLGCEQPSGLDVKQSPDGIHVGNRETYCVVEPDGAQVARSIAGENVV